MQNIFVYYIFTIDEWDGECNVSYGVETNSTNA
jgi:hypothetical protein